MQWLVIHARMAPPHTRVCGWRHITRQATLLACVTELGETGSSLKPGRCDDTTSNHPNHLLLGFRAYALNSHTKQIRKGRTRRAGQGRAGQGRANPGQGRAGQVMGGTGPSRVLGFRRRLRRTKGPDLGCRL